MSFCMNCGRELPPEAGFCPKCGTKVKVPVCPSCGKMVDPGDDFCLYCGARLRQEPEPVPEPEPVKEKAIVCPACGREQSADRSVCWACGEKFAFDSAGNLITPEPEPKPGFKRVAQIPEVCPRCGKPGVKGYEHCVYCGTPWKVIEVPEVCPKCGTPSEDGYDHCVNCGTPWETEEKPKPIKSAAKPAEDQARQTAQEPAPEALRSFFWNYRRAMVRWNMRMTIHAQVDDQRLYCTSTSTILGQVDTAQEEMELKDITKITIGSRASFLLWVVMALTLAVFVGMPMLPLFGIPLALVGGELIVALMVLAALFALEVWWTWFNLYHHRMTITGTVDGAEKKIILDAKKASVLRELQEELTRKTGVRLSNDGSMAEVKLCVGAVIGVALGVVLLIGLANELPHTAGTATRKSASSGTTTGYARSTPAPIRTPVPIQTPAPTPEKQSVSWSDYMGSWSCDDRMYGLEISCPPGSAVGTCTFMQMLVEDGIPGMENTSFSVTLRADGCLSGNTGGSDPSLAIELYYDGYGLSGWVYNCMGGKDDYAELYFEPI